MSDLHFLTIAEASRLIRDRKLSPVELTRAFLDRIDAIDPQLNAYLLVTADRGLCGAFNTNLIRETVKYLAKYDRS